MSLVFIHCTVFVPPNPCRHTYCNPLNASIRVSWCFERQPIISVCMQLWLVSRDHSHKQLLLTWTATDITYLSSLEKQSNRRGLTHKPTVSSKVLHSDTISVSLTSNWEPVRPGTVKKKHAVAVKHHACMHAIIVTTNFLTVCSACLHGVHRSAINLLMRIGDKDACEQAGWMPMRPARTSASTTGWRMLLIMKLFSIVYQHTL